MLIERFLLTSPISIHRDAIGLIVAACEKLKTGTSTVDDLWPGKPRSLSSLLSDQVVFEEAQKEMWSLREASRAVQKLQSSLNAKMHFLQRTVYPAVLHHGLANMPDEILERILSETLSEMKSMNPFSRVEYRKNIDSLSLVNHRFHSLILHTPTVLIDARGNELCCRSSEVLKNRAHALLYTGNTFYSRVKDFADDLVTLTFQPRIHWTVQGEPLRVELLPRLVELKMEMCEEFISAHQLPSLRRLSTSIEPSCISKLAKVMPQLTHLTITTIISPPGSLASIASILALGRELHYLDLNFRIPSSHDSEHFAHVGHSHCLPAVKTLQLGLRYQFLIPEEVQVITGAISAFLQSLGLPKLCLFGVILSSTEIGDLPLDSVMRHLISGLRHKECLRHFSFGILDVHSYNSPKMSFQDWLHHLPSLLSLTLANVRITMDDTSFAELARLRDVTIEECVFERCTLEDFLIRILQASSVSLKALELIKMREGEDHRIHTQLSQATNSLSGVSEQDFYAELTSITPLELQYSNPRSYEFDDIYDNFTSNDFDDPYTSD